MENAESKKVPKELKAWEKEKKLIPVMIRKYCHGKHGTRGKELCEECRGLCEYAPLPPRKMPVQGQQKVLLFPAKYIATSRRCGKRSKM